MSAPSTEKNVRPVSPRGMAPFGGDLSIDLDARGLPQLRGLRAPSIAVLIRRRANAAAGGGRRAAVRSGPAPLAVRFDGSLSTTRIRAARSRAGSGTSATAPAASGRGASSTPTRRAAATSRRSPSPTTEGAETHLRRGDQPSGCRRRPSSTPAAASGATVHGAVDPENQPTSWYFEYGPTSQYGAVTPAETLPAPEALHQVSGRSCPGLVAGRLYHYRLVAVERLGQRRGRGPAARRRQRPPAPTPIATPCSPPRARLLLAPGRARGQHARRTRSRAAPPGRSPAASCSAEPGVLGPLANTAAELRRR